MILSNCPFQIGRAKKSRIFLFKLLKIFGSRKLNIFRGTYSGTSSKFSFVAFEKSWKITFLLTFCDIRFFLWTLLQIEKPAKKKKKELGEKKYVIYFTYSSRGPPKLICGSVLRALNYTMYERSQCERRSNTPTSTTTIIKISKIQRHKIW